MKLTHILTAHIWNAGIEWYDYLDCIEFYEDGRGQMCYGDNQCLRSDVYFVYHFIDGQTIVFEYLTASQGFRGRTFELTDAAIPVLEKDASCQGCSIQNNSRVTQDAVQVHTVLEQFHLDV